MPVLANDTATGGSGADLVPLVVTDVRMASEDIRIRADGHYLGCAS